MSNQTVAAWIKIAIHDKEADLTVLPKPELNGLSADLQVKEAIDTLVLIRKQSGMEAAQKVWSERLAKTIPDIACIVERPRRIFHASELKNRPPLRWLVEGEIPDKGVTVIYGAPEVGKSFLALDYAERVAQRSPALYIAAEGGSGYYQRHEAWMRHHKMKETKLHFIDEPIFLLQKGELERLIEEAREIKPRLIVMDTLSQCFVGGEENSNSDMAAFVAYCHRICKELECAIILVHHVTKGGNGERGASSLRGNVESMIEVDNDDDVIRVMQSKLKDRKKGDMRKLRRLEVGIEPGITSCVLVEAGLVVPEENELNPNQRSIMEILSSKSYDQGARSGDLQRSSGLSGTTYYRVIESLAQRGLICKQGKFDPWIITAKGKLLSNRLKLSRAA